MASVSQLVQSLEGVSSATFSDEADRILARDALAQALRKIQSPWDIAWEHIYVNTATFACVKTLIDAGVFAKWVDIGGQPTTAGHLAELVKADELLVKRLLRQIAGQHLIVEVGEDEYATTPWVERLVSDPAFTSMYGEFSKSMVIPMHRTLPYFLQTSGFQNPTDAANSNWQYMTGTKNSCFENVGANVALRESFNNAMQCHSKYNLTAWPDVYPTEKLLEGAKTDRALVVDMGGGKGHDLEKFVAVHPNVSKGSLILQDLPGTLEDVKTSEAITVQPHDFFRPQPVIGARAYFMHNVLHDWTDPDAIRILKNIVAVMEPGYSKVIVHESLISTRNPSPRVTVTDITVMACVSGKERTEKEWTGLFEAAGLFVVKVWKTALAAESVIEAEVAV